MIASAGPSGALALRLRQAAEAMAPEEAEPVPELPRHPKRYIWAMLLARIYDLLPLVCPRCGHAMRLVAFITESVEIRRILAHVGEPVRAPGLSPPRAPPQGEFSWDQGAGEDPGDLQDADFDQRGEHSEEPW